MPVLLALDDRRRTALLVGAVYFLLESLSSVASRYSHTVAGRTGNEERGARRLWAMDLATFGVLAVGLLANWQGLAIAAFVALAVLQNFWRPLLIARVADQTISDRMATVLSVESQAKSLFAAAMAPLIGWAADCLPAQTTLRFAPAAVLGMVIAAGMLATGRRMTAR
jgi:hypothetical protein